MNIVAGILSSPKDILLH